MSNPTCYSCEAQPATRFLTQDASYDPCCEACFTRDFTECPSCGRAVQPDDLIEVLVSRATRDEPADYDTVCQECAQRDHERSAGDDDGFEYADPRDAMPFLYSINNE